MLWQEVIYGITATSFHDHFVPNHFVPSFGHFVPYRSKIIKTLSNRGLFEFKLNEIVMTMIKVKGKKSDDVVMTKRGHASAWVGLLWSKHGLLIENYQNVIKAWFVQIQVKCSCYLL